MGMEPVAASREDEEAKKMEAGGDTVGQKLDAGALFVLQSKGSWLHCGYHLTTSIVAPPLLSLPFAFAALGWTAGIICLVIGAAVTFYSYNLISRVLEHHAQQGRRQLRFRDMATDILDFKLKHVVNIVQQIGQSLEASSVGTPRAAAPNN